VNLKKNFREWFLLKNGLALILSNLNFFCLIGFRKSKRPLLLPVPACADNFGIISGLRQAIPHKRDRCE
jgi:hypothetical protein